MFRKPLLSIISAVVLALAFLPLSAGAQAQPKTTCQTFSETGKSICDRFLNYWNTHGGLAQQGYPITNEFQEQSNVDGKTYTVQYFERAEFEYHPENQAPYDVLLALLGSIVFKQKYPNGVQEMPPPMNPVAGLTFPETGKEIREPFLTYWKTHGGLMQQGYPITNLVQEKSDLDGQTYTVQYFQRAVFELHPEKQPPYNILLSQLGTTEFKLKYPNGQPQPGNTLKAGMWGGRGLILTVTDTGATAEFDCAHGSINGPITMDQSGKVAATGVFVFEHGGPVRQDEPADSHPATYAGTTTGQTFNLTITLNDTNQVIGTFNLTFGQTGRIVKCLAPTSP